MKSSLRKKLLWLLFASRGGATRMRLLEELRERPGNTYELSRRLRLNYRTVKYHLELMREHGLVDKVGEGYGAVYILSDELEESWEELEELKRRMVCRK